MTWSPSKGNRFRNEHEIRSRGMPEPGTYNPSDTHSQNDSYLLSTFKNPGVKRIIAIR
jgi:hypothetical protein